MKPTYKKKLILKSGRSTKFNNASHTMLDMAKKHSETELTNVLERDHCSYCHSDIRQTDKLTEHTRVVQRHRGTCQVTWVRLVIDTRHTIILKSNMIFMNLKRRKNKHWQIHRQ